MCQLELVGHAHQLKALAVAEASADDLDSEGCSSLSSDWFESITEGLEAIENFIVV